MWKNSIVIRIIDTGMQLQINGKEKMNMLQDGLETFFHTVEIVV